METLSKKPYGNIVVIQHPDYKWGIEDTAGNVIVPFGKYDWIDGFDQGLARVKIGKRTNGIKNNGNKWGIINENGEEVLPVEYDDIWNFLGKNRFSTRVIKEGKASNIYFHDLNPALPVRKIQFQNIRNKYENFSDNASHYGDFAGTYAQDVAGYSDDTIYDAFEGDPDAYWNID